ncbi:MAG: hypothetical protein RJA63_105 [Pseudomonadota bacterium]
MNILRPELRAVLPHLILCGLLLLLGGRRGGAFIIVPFLPFLLVSLPWAVYVLWRKPEKRRQQFVIMVLWTMTISAVLGLAEWQGRETRSKADAIIIDLENYRDKHGTYPVRLEDVGYGSADLHTNFGIVYSMPKRGDGMPYFRHRSAHNLFDLYVWNAVTKAWEYQPD